MRLENTFEYPTDRTMVIGIDGPDGVGKTTILKILQSEISSVKIVSCDFDMPKDVCEFYKQTIKTNSIKQWILFYDVYTSLIRKFSKETKIVFTDRCLLSHIVYQLLLQNDFDRQYINYMFYKYGRVWNLVFVLLQQPEIIKQNMRQRNTDYTYFDKIDQITKHFFELVKNTYQLEFPFKIVPVLNSDIETTVWFIKTYLQL